VFLSISKHIASLSASLAVSARSDMNDKKDIYIHTTGVSAILTLFLLIYGLISLVVDIIRWWW